VPPIPPEAPAPPTAHIPERHQIKQFSEMDESTQLSVLSSMHGRFADVLNTQGVISGAQRAAWRVSYTAYDKETGANSQGRANAEGDATGNRIRPIDIIQRDGDLSRFHEIVRKTWQR